MDAAGAQQFCECVLVVHEHRNSIGGGGDAGLGLHVGRVVVAIAIEVFAGLATQQPTGEPAGGLDRRPQAGIGVEPGRHDFHDRVGDVEPDQVHQLEGTHPQSDRIPGDAVDIGHRGDTLRQQREGFGGQGPPEVVHHEAWSVLGVHRGVSERRHETRCGGDEFGRGAHAGDHLDESHERNRVEEVQAEKPGWVLQSGGAGCSAGESVRTPRYPVSRVRLGMMTSSTRVCTV